MKKHSFQHDLDHPLRSVEHRDLILKKAYLKKTYVEWYQRLIRDLPTDLEGMKLEIGSGGGFLPEILPDVVTSDILKLDYCDYCFSAEKLPFEDESLSAIMMVNVLHHIPTPELFFKEAERCLKKGGKILIIEPTKTLLSSFFYKNFHHEPFDTKANWKLSEGGPLSHSNQAMPWIILKRDKENFKQKFPNLEIKKYKRLMPINNVLSGGLSWPALVPFWSYRFFSFIEFIHLPVVNLVALFAFAEIEKK